MNSEVGHFHARELYKFVIAPCMSLLMNLYWRSYLQTHSYFSHVTLLSFREMEKAKPKEIPGKDIPKEDKH